MALTITITGPQETETLEVSAQVVEALEDQRKRTLASTLETFVSSFITQKLLGLVGRGALRPATIVLEREHRQALEQAVKSDFYSSTRKQKHPVGDPTP